MLKQLYANNASTTLASAVSPGNTTITVASAAAFPKPGANEYFRVTIDSGVGVEVIFVYGVAGNSFVNCVRGQEGTIAQNFQAGTLIECRPTKGTFEQFARYQDRLGEIASVDVLDTPSNSDGNSYITTAVDDGGNPIVAIKKNNQVWRFVTHPNVVTNGGVGAGSTPTRMLLPAASTLLPIPVAGKYLVQFISGVNQGLVRAITVVDDTSIYWSTPLPVAPATGDSFEIYRSVASSIDTLMQAADSGLLFSILFLE